MVNPQDYTYLGTMNMWKEEPEEYKKCKEEKHILKEERVANCWKRYYCEVCKHYYEVDSSG